MSARSRKHMVGWLGEADVRSTFEAIPAQFAYLFDEIFGARHLSLGCFVRSCLASSAALIFVYGFALSFGLDAALGNSWGWSSMSLLLLAGAMMNFVPDYFSLMETRWLDSVSYRVFGGELASKV